MVYQLSFADKLRNLDGMITHIEYEAQKINEGHIITPLLKDINIYREFIKDYHLIESKKHWIRKKHDNLPFNPDRSLLILEKYFKKNLN